MLGIAEPYTRLPLFFSDQDDLGMEYRGFAPRWDRVVFRGDPRGRKFMAWKVGKPITALIEGRRTVAPERLEDPSIALGDLTGDPPPLEVLSRSKGVV